MKRNGRRTLLGWRQMHMLFQLSERGGRWYDLPAAGMSGLGRRATYKTLAAMESHLCVIRGRTSASDGGTEFFEITEVGRWAIAHDGDLPGPDILFDKSKRMDAHNKGVMARLQAPDDAPAPPPGVLHSTAHYVRAGWMSADKALKDSGGKSVG